MVARAGLRRVRRHARLHHHPRAARVRLRQGIRRPTARHLSTPAQALQRRVHPRHVRRLDPGRLPLRPVQRARVRHGEHRVHIRAGLLRVRVRRYVRQLARGPIRLQEVRHPLRHRLRDRRPTSSSSSPAASRPESRTRCCSARSSRGPSRRRTGCAWTAGTSSASSPRRRSSTPAAPSPPGLSATSSWTSRGR